MIALLEHNNCKGSRKVQPWLNLTYFACMCLERLTGTTKYFSRPKWAQPGTSKIRCKSDEQDVLQNFDFTSSYYSSL